MVAPGMLEGLTVPSPYVTVVADDNLGQSEKPEFHMALIVD